MINCKEEIDIPVSTMKTIELEAKALVENICEDIVYRSMDIGAIDARVCPDNSLSGIFTKLSSWVITFLPKISHFTSKQINTGMSGLILDGASLKKEGYARIAFSRFEEHVSVVLENNNEINNLVNKRSFELISEIYENSYNFVENLGLSIKFYFNEERSEFEPFIVAKIKIERVDQNV